MFRKGITTPPLEKTRQQARQSRVSGALPRAEKTLGHVAERDASGLGNVGNFEGAAGQRQRHVYSPPEPRRKSPLGGVGHFKGLKIMKRD